MMIHSKGQGPYACLGRRGSKIPYEIHGFQRSNKSKVSAISKVSRASGISPRGHGFKGIICQRLQKFQSSRTSGVKG